MPIKPFKRKDSPVWYGVGTHLRKYVNRSTGARSKALCRKVIRKWEGQIERGEFAEPRALTFATAVVKYLKAGGDGRPVTKLLNYFSEDGRSTRLLSIDQDAIDDAAFALFPTHSAATRNREVYTPMSAIMKHAGMDFRIRRPKGSRGRELLGWLKPEDADRLLTACYKVDEEFGIFCHVLPYTGLRLMESTLRFKTDNLSLRDCYALIPRTKNGKPRAVHLPMHVVVALANHPRGLDRPGERVFRFQKGGHLYKLLRRAAAMAGILLPERQAFHLFRHCYGAWMRRYGGADARALVAGGAWDSIQSVGRYEHAIASEEAKRADMLPFGKVG